MRRLFYLFCISFILFCFPFVIFSQGSLTIEKIMEGERFTGFSPENIQWSPAGNKIYFTWNPDMEKIRSLYVAGTDSKKPEKVSLEARKHLAAFNGNYNKNRSLMVYAKDGDLFLMDLKTGSAKQITSTLAFEGTPVFSRNEDKIIYSSGNNLFSWEISTGTTVQLTDFRTGKERPEEMPYSNDREKWLYNNQLSLIKVLSERKEIRDLAMKEGEALEPDRPKVIYTGQGQPRSLMLSPDNNYLTWQIMQPAEDKRTIIPNYVTESAYTEDMQSRSKVGMSSFSSGNINIYDINRDTIYKLKTDDIPGLNDKTDYVKDYPVKKSDESGKPAKADNRSFRMGNPVWSGDSKFAIADVFSNDSKDRWIMLIDI